MSIMTLSGWGQPHDALKVVAPEAFHLDYADYGNINEALAAIGNLGRTHDIAIGWSLGGQLLVRAVAEGVFKPKKLVLIAAPFQFVTTAQSPLGMGQDTFDKFRNNFAADPSRTLDKAWELLMVDDKHHDKIRHVLAGHNKQNVLAKDWLKWLHWLDGYSCHHLPMRHFPPTLIVHGDKDAVVFMEQSRQFAKVIPGSTLHIVKDCGHAPHWHDTELLQQHIEDYIRV